MSAPSLAERVHDAVLGHPAVHALTTGAYGTVTSYQPGRRVVGVRTGVGGTPVEIAVVLYFGQPVPRVVDELRRRVREVAGPVPVDVVIADLVERSVPRPRSGSR
ncbi:hypothetical protein [Goodfellowiella coeruleoviolacea]|uniref:hypothetical protein n=1 Tax=Goodfellowiella coeruleoviolacea TaxID=334858 RepID=UPI0020A2B3AB|nr:hypothetical protein [Goodfellowiella coeruleoviolacea]